MPISCSAAAALSAGSHGEQAAGRLARRCARAGVAAAVIVSELGDFNDDPIARGPEALAARLIHLFRAAPIPAAERERSGSKAGARGE